MQGKLYTVKDIFCRIVGKKKMMTLEEKYMREAIRQAKKAAALKEVPIGCVIVHDNKIIGRGYNRRISDKNVLAHAEIAAIHKACRVIGDWRLEECTMYVTLEPCPMCAGAIVQARIPKVVIGCMNPKAGCAGSVLDMFHEDGFNHQVETEIGLLGEECSKMLKDFFKELREEGKRKKQEAAAALARDLTNPGFSDILSTSVQPGS